MDALRPRLSIGVVLFQTPPAELARCLRSVAIALAQPGAPAALVLLRDHSPDDRLRASLPAGLAAAYEHASDNRGFGAGQNALAREGFARGADAHLCLNPDAALHPRALDELWRTFESSPEAGLIEAQQFPDEHAKVYAPLTLQTPWCSGCCLLIPHDTFEATGGFDERFFHAGEDVDLSWRVRAAGKVCLIEPRALVLHFVTDRPDDAARHALLLRASALLGAKYGDRAYVDFCLADLRTLGQELPRLPDFDPPDARMRAVADFAHRFAFAETRW